MYTRIFLNQEQVQTHLDAVWNFCSENAFYAIAFAVFFFSARYNLMYVMYMATCTCDMMSSTHYSDVVMSAVASQIILLKGIYRWPVDSPLKGPVTPKMYPFDDIITVCTYLGLLDLKLYAHKYTIYNIASKSLH